MKFKINISDLDTQLSLLNEQAGIGQVVRKGAPEILQLLRGARSLSRLAQGVFQGFQAGIRQAAVPQSIVKLLGDQGVSAKKFIEYLFSENPGLKLQMKQVVNGLAEQIEQGKILDDAGNPAKVVTTEFTAKLTREIEPGVAEVIEIPIHVAVDARGIVPNGLGIGAESVDDVARAADSVPGVAKASDDATRASDDATRAAGEAAEELADPGRLGSASNPYKSLKDALEAIQGPKMFKYKDHFDDAKRLSRKYPDLEIPARPPLSPARITDPYIFVKSGNTNAALTYKGGKLSLLHPDKTVNVTMSQLQDLMQTFDETTGLLDGALQGKLPRALKTPSREWDIAKTIWFPADLKLATIARKLSANLFDLLTMTPLRPFASAIRILASELGAIGPETALSLAQWMRWFKITTSVILWVTWILDKGYGMMNSFDKMDFKRRLLWAEEMYGAHKTQENLDRLKGVKAEIISRGQDFIRASGGDPSSVKTVKQAFKVYEDYKGWMAQTHDALEPIINIMDEYSLGGALQKVLWEENTMIGKIDQNPKQDDPIQDAGERLQKRRALGRHTQPGRTEVDTTDEPSVKDAVKDQGIPDTDTDTGPGAWLNEALSSNNIILKPAKTSVKMKVKLTELNNED